MTELTIDVVGTPAPQGSKRGFVVNGRVVMSESSKKVKPWRQDVKAAALDTLDGDPPIEGPVALTIVFEMPRPGYHYRTGARSHELKPNAPRWVSKQPDVSKLVRSTEDALTEARVWRDDAQVARLVVEQVYADAQSGARITVSSLDPQSTVSVSGDEAVETGTVHTIQETLL